MTTENHATHEERAPTLMPFDAAILKLNQRSARVRRFLDGEEITYRASGFWKLVPGQIVTLQPERRWTYGGHAYASGSVANPRIEIAALGLKPLRLEDQGLMDPREIHEPIEEPPLLRRMWLQTSKPRHHFEMEQVLPGFDPVIDDMDEDPITRASELNRTGERMRAREILMDLLVQDLRCLDAHAHLGNFAFDRWPEEALLHYNVGVRIGELSLGAGFTGLLPWGCVDNRPFLRCLHGKGLILWRLGRLKEAEQVFERMLWLNPADNQGARFCWLDVKAGRSWTSSASEA